MPQDKLLTLEETAQMLNLPEDTILDMVAENKLSAVMQNGKMNFRASDVEAAGGAAPSASDDFDLDLEPEADENATQEISFAEDEEVGLGTEEIIFEDDDLNIQMDDEPSAGATESVTATDDTSVTIAEEAPEDDAYGLDDESAHERPDVRGGGMPGVAAGGDAAFSPMGGAAYAAPEGGMGWAVLLIAAAVIGIVIPLTILVADAYQGVALRGGAYTVSDFSTDGSIPKLGGAVVPPHINAIIDAVPAEKLLGVPELDSSLTIEGFKEKWKPKAKEIETSEGGEEAATDEEGTAEGAPEAGPEGAPAEDGENPFAPAE